MIEGFWKQEPGLAGVLRGAFSRRVFVVPLFISEGYFSSEVIPRELGFGGDSKLQIQNSSLFYCRVVGTHDSMTGVILARATATVKKFPFPFEHFLFLQFFIQLCLNFP